MESISCTVHDNSLFKLSHTTAPDLSFPLPYPHHSSSPSLYISFPHHSLLSIPRHSLFPIPRHSFFPIPHHSLVPPCLRLVRAYNTCARVSVPKLRSHLSLILYVHVYTQLLYMSVRARVKTTFHRQYTIA